MQQKTVTEIGNIIDTNHNHLIKMWTVNVPNGQRAFQSHSHFNFEIMYVNKGSGTYTTATADYPMVPGDFFIFSSNESHCITNVGSNGLTITNLQFNPQFIWSSGSEINTNINFNFCFYHDQSFSNRIPSKSAGDLLPFFLQIQQELSHAAIEHNLSIRSLLYLFLIELVRNHGYSANLPNRNREQIHSIQHTLHYIDTHFTEKITLQELSDLAGLTPTYFSTLFKEVVGIPLWNYISSKRIEKAIRLITSDETTESMIQIALECGFNNTANFNKTFKKITGTTPREYKNNSDKAIS